MSKLRFYALCKVTCGIGILQNTSTKKAEVLEYVSSLGCTGAVTYVSSLGCTGAVTSAFNMGFLFPAEITVPVLLLTLIVNCELRINHYHVVSTRLFPSRLIK